PFLVVVSLVEQLLDWLGFAPPATPVPSGLLAAGANEYVLGAVLVLVVAVTEETVFRGYLLLRFTNITGNWVAAMLLSTVIFAIGHGYEGTIGIITVGVMGAIFSLVYLWRGSLVTPITLHFLQDFIGIILIPLLKK
ncbi:MAG: CPBP family intramembrane metalloprotease, partial [Candidatus Hydrogenedentes bacterium]|nr:CPBP family intramembrane metalloprotease [Candidatus Hydrogenedentota bacterium]